MSIRACRVLAVDGTCNSGKTTLALALTAHYRAAGVDAGYVSDVAGDSSLLADVAVRSPGVGDLSAELDVLAATISGQIRAARRHRLLVVDRTAASVLVHARVALRHDERDEDAWVAVEALCRSWRPYDLVVCLDEQQQLDPNTESRTEDDGPRLTGGMIVNTLQEAGYPLVHLPAGLSLRQRVAWAVTRASRRGINREVPSRP